MIRHVVLVCCLAALPIQVAQAAEARVDDVAIDAALGRLAARMKSFRELMSSLSGADSPPAEIQYSWAESIQSRVDFVSTLSLIRSSMRDGADREVVQRFLLSEVKRVRNACEDAQQSTNKSLARVQSPGLAIMMGKLQDELAAVCALTVSVK